MVVTVSKSAVKNKHLIFISFSSWMVSFPRLSHQSSGNLSVVRARLMKNEMFRLLFARVLGGGQFLNRDDRYDFTAGGQSVFETFDFALKFTVNFAVDFAFVAVFANG